ncbi:MAG TPA: GMC family oxidoreductase [Gemmatimonadaceae bacterium]|jgi:choline dehydrogenase-like flavoprotein|nr:GMC family oxidoreductase [Gemmatimonadaceae bacterium]
MPDHTHPRLAPLQQTTVKYRPDDEVDFVIVGSGAAGGVVAKELSTAGFRVVVLEQGPWRTERDFVHDEIKIFQQSALSNDWNVSPTTFRKTEKDKAQKQPALVYARGVGGTSVHFSANFWRFKEIDFKEASVKGTLAGTGFADWPITYQDLEPYYTKVDWEVGVAGAPGPFDPPRSRPYPMPPHPPKSTGVLLERGAKKLGYKPFPAPMAIASKPFDGRSQCVQCGFCEGFGCEVRAKSSSLVSVIPKAVASGRCEIRPNSYARKIETDAKGRATGVKYFDADKKEAFQRAKAVVVCANGAETPRLLLNSASNLFPHGLANSSGVVGKYLMPNGAGLALGVFDHEVNGFKGIVATRVVWDLYELDPKLGLVGGGGFDYRFDATPIQFASDIGIPPKAPRWGKAYKRWIAQTYTRSVICFGHTTSLPVATNSISLDPTVKDAWGVPAIRMTYADHPQDLKLYKYFAQRSEELLHASGAAQTWQLPVDSQEFAVHLLGTCRMGNDPKTSVVDKYNRAHDVRNLFVVDGSSLVTSGRGQPTMTIQALAFRAGDNIAQFAKRREI